MSPVMASTPYPCQQIQSQVQGSTQCLDPNQVKLRYISQPPSGSELSSSIPGRVFDKPPAHFLSCPGEVGFSDRLSGSPPVGRSAPCTEIRYPVLQRGFSDRPVGSPPAERSAPCPEIRYQDLQRGFSDRPVGSPSAERSAPCPENGSQLLQRGFSDRLVSSPPVEKTAPCPENGSQVIQRRFSNRPVGSPPAERSAQCPENGSQVMQRRFSNRPVGSPPAERSAPCPENGSQVMQRRFSNRPVGSPPAERSAPCPENGSQVMQRRFSNRPVGSPPAERSAPFREIGSQVMQRRFSLRSTGTPPVERSAPCSDIDGSQRRYYEVNSLPEGVILTRSRARIANEKEQFEVNKMNNREVIDALMDSGTQTENKNDSKDNQNRLSRKLEKLESENMVERFLSNVPDIGELKADAESSAATPDVPDISDVHKTEPEPKPIPKPEPTPKPSPNPNSNSKNVKTSTLSSSTKHSEHKTSPKAKPLPKEIPKESYLIPGSGRGVSSQSSYFFMKSPKTSKAVLSDHDEESETSRHVGRKSIYLKIDQPERKDPNSPKGQLSKSPESKSSPSKKSLKSPEIKSLKSTETKSLKSPDIKSLKSTETKSLKSPEIKSLKSPEIKSLKSPETKSLKSPETKSLKSTQRFEIKSLKSLGKKSSKSKSNSTVSTPPESIGKSAIKSNNKSKNSCSEINIVKYFSNYTPEEMMQLFNELASIDSNLVSSVLEGYPESTAAVLGLVSRKTSLLERSPSDNSSLKSNDDSEIGKLFLKPVAASATDSGDSYGDLREMNFRIGYDDNLSNNANNDHGQSVDVILVDNEDSIDRKPQKTLKEDNLNNADGSNVTTYNDPSIGDHLENQCSIVSAESWSDSEDSACDDFQFFKAVRVRRKTTLWDTLRGFSGRIESVTPEDEVPLIRRGRKS